MPVSIELVLALDASASMDRNEFDMQVKGLVEAFRDPEVMEAIRNLGPHGAAVAVTQWGGPGEARVILPFAHLTTEASSRAFAFRLSRTQRGFIASSTSVATAINDGLRQMDRNSFVGDRRVIDISGDGIDNAGTDLQAAREAAASAHVEVNGLPIGDEEGLQDYYRTKVIVGPDAFTVPARDFYDYPRAIKEKLLRELRPIAS
ncbi:MAG: DUF1194 domain-containing protein [Hyphomicrobiales bacterium]